MRHRVWIVTLVVGTLFLTALQAAANPPSLTWGTQALHTSNMNACSSFAQTAMKQLGVDRIWTTGPYQVDALRQNSHLLILCQNVRVGPASAGWGSVSAQIIVASNDPGQADALLTSLQQLIGGIATY